jgi:hypothetical protein
MTAKRMTKEEAEKAMTTIKTIRFDQVDFNNHEELTTAYKQLLHAYNAMIAAYQEKMREGK